MSDIAFGLAKGQLANLAAFLFVRDNLPMPGVTVPQVQPQAAGVHEIWAGLGIVGIWAALDAYGDAAGRKGGSLYKKFRTTVDPVAQTTLRELDDLRNLFAHNIAGVSGRAFFARKKQDRLICEGKRYEFTGGCHFTGVRDSRIVVKLDHFASYLTSAENILDAVHG